MNDLTATSRYDGLPTPATAAAPAVAVLGAGGQLGHDLLRVLGDDGRYRVEGFARGELDVTDKAALERTIEPGRFEAVINTAALTNVDLCEERSADALEVNANGAYLVARACARAGCRHVLIGTDFVFDGERDGPYREEDRPHPINVYGASKLAGENLAAIALPDTLVLRISSVFGSAGSRGKGGNFVETILARARAGEQLRVVDDTTMSPSYTMDVARALSDLLEVQATGVVHASNEGSCTWHEFASRALENCGIEVRVEGVSSGAFPRPARRPLNSALASNRLEALIGRKMPSWQAALHEYLLEQGYLSESEQLSAGRFSAGRRGEDSTEEPS